MHDNVVDQYFFHVSHACGSCTGLSFLVSLLFWFSLSIRWGPDFICCLKKICILNNRGGAGRRHFFKHIYRLSVDNIAHIISRRHSIYAVSKKWENPCPFLVVSCKTEERILFLPVSSDTLYKTDKSFWLLPVETYQWSDLPRISCSYINKEKNGRDSVETMSVSACISAHFLLLIVIYSGWHSLRTESLCGTVSAFLISRNCNCVFLFHNNPFLFC